jgi:hypothetical protein
MTNNTISARISEKDKTLVIRVCKDRGEDISDFVRRSIRKELASLSFLTSEEKKALGVKTDDQNNVNQGS